MVNSTVRRLAVCAVLAMLMASTQGIVSAVQGATATALPTLAPSAALSGSPKWEATGGPTGGVISTLALDPSNPNRVYAAGVGGAIYVSDNAAATWTATDVFAPHNDEFRRIVVDPETPSTVFALAMWGALYRSDNSAATWNPSPGLEADVVHTDFSMSQSDPNWMIVGGPGVLSVSSDGGLTWNDVSGSLDPGINVRNLAAGTAGEFWMATDATDGRLFHTTNGGTVWNEIDLSSQMPDGSAIDGLWVNPSNQSNVIAGLFFYANLGGAPGDAAMLRTNNGGANWDAIHLPGPPVGGLVAGYDANLQAMYVSTMADLYRSTNGGANWDRVGLPTTISTVDPVQIAIDPRDSDVLYLPTRGEGVAKSTDMGATWFTVNDGISATVTGLVTVPPEGGTGDTGGTVFANGAPGLFRSTNWGDTWERIDRPDIFHPFIDEIVFNPHNLEEIWVVADTAQMFVSSDGGDSWTLRVDTREGGSGFRFGSIYAAEVAPSNSDVIYAVKAGFGIFRSDDAGETWSFFRDSEVDYSYTLAVNPFNPNIVFSGYNPKPSQDYGMVRRSSDGGSTWATALKLDGASGVTSVVIDPTNPDNIYAGAPSDSGGLLRVSRDGGEVWSELGGLDFTNIHAMAASPTDANKAAAALWGGGVFFTWDGGATWTEISSPTLSASAVMMTADRLYLADRNSPRIYRAQIPTSPSSNWGTWDTVLDAGSGHYRVLAAAEGGGVIYASVFSDPDKPLDGSVFRITDSGVTNVTYNLSTLPVALAVDPSNPNVAYAAVHTAGGGVYRLSGNTWTLLSGAGSGIPQTPAIGFSGIKAVVESGSTVLYLLGGSDAYFTPGGIEHTGADPADMFTIYRSGDGGSSWVNLNDGHFGSSSGPIKGLVPDPDDSSTLFAGAARGVYSSTDNGATWNDVSSGLGYTPTAGVDVSADGNQIYAPTLGGGMFTGSVGSSATVTWQPDSALAASVEHIQLLVHPSNSNIIYASAYPGGVFRSDDGGATWTERNFGLPSFEVDDPLRQGYYSLVQAPSNPDIVYLGMYGVGVYRSNDGAATWFANGAGSLADGAPITALEVDPANPNHLWAATEQGILVSENGGATWSTFDTGLESVDIRTLQLDATGRLVAGTRGYELYASPSGTAAWTQLGALGNWGAIWPIWDDRPLYQYTSVLFHPTNPSVVYMGSFPSGIFRSDDGGNTWRESNVGWGNDGVFSLLAHPTNPDIIYAGTYNGVNRSVDGGDHWESWDTGWPKEQWVFSIAFDPRDPDIMYAASKNGENEGRGSTEFHGTVMKSTDGGATWSEITDGLDTMQEFYAIVADPHDPDIVYLGTQNDGVMISYQGGQDGWSSWSDGLTNPYAGTNGNNVTANLVLSTDQRYLYFGTAGSGVFRGRLESWTFDDVPPDYLFFTNIEWLADEGVTKGCNPPRNTDFCPDQPVTRAQMASFLTRALNLPPATGDHFTDDTTSVHQANINALAQAGITKGCNPPRNTDFCPDQPVTRAQMASFLTRALNLPPATGDHFTDDTTSVHQANINALAQAGITKGCNPPANDRFCPNNQVTRAQMAAFLHRAIG